MIILLTLPFSYYQLFLLNKHCVKGGATRCIFLQISQERTCPPSHERQRNRYSSLILMSKAQLWGQRASLVFSINCSELQFCNFWMSSEMPIQEVQAVADCADQKTFIKIFIPDRAVSRQTRQLPIKEMPTRKTFHLQGIKSPEAGNSGLVFNVCLCGRSVQSCRLLTGCGKPREETEKDKLSVFLEILQQTLNFLKAQFITVHYSSCL